MNEVNHANNAETALLTDKLIAKDSELAAANEKIKQLEDTLSQKNLELESAHTVNAQLSGLVETLSIKAESKTAEPSFELDRTLYGFHYHRTVFQGKSISHEEVLASVELQAALVASGSGMIKPLN